MCTLCVCVCTVCVCLHKAPVSYLKAFLGRLFNFKLYLTLFSLVKLLSSGIIIWKRIQEKNLYLVCAIYICSII